ncbi:hypothetical protein FQA47_024122 [Oryzias melastigma]|uniref:Uncharacterized protein n=1 Tax=Oryzias melastigma TaxID=30732 RepID=A0A834CPP5_ORYME|nr:hypothetical protein FQA47_024122 [Oryzias melastigma]
MFARREHGQREICGVFAQSSGSLSKEGWHPVNTLETGFSCSGSGSAGKKFSECQILLNLWPAQSLMPLTPSILFPSANRRTPFPPPLLTSIQPERGERSGDRPSY